MRAETQLGMNVNEAPSVTHAVERVVDAAQHLVLDQVGLLRLEAKVIAQDTMARGALVAIALMVLSVTWGFLVAIAYLVLETRVPSPVARLGILAAVHGVIGAVLLIVGMQRVRREDDDGTP